ncbi:peptidyl-tRNA hydrolase [Vittaforma corneae ATCC 50505]|uniref:peptidyl-tRNA hydrolase n=1 Tax=Vittaforma corneae (strain ATCC 50505) TaxID=993615 RepID=L2GMT3_VITCO|nr:peptidyl-tRNA hydrolase [Vittaforma corneae ATCC 50505]ELA41949.1 peptidyl-tRNA hydrolase [Vittaforma corneae ATCC 50505]
MYSFCSFFWPTATFILLGYILYPRVSQRIRKIRVREGDYQVVVIVNRDLGMSKGKVLSQFGHAIDSLHERLKDHPDLVRAWRNNGSAKIALKGTQEDLNKAYYDAKTLGMPYVRIFDAGKTQVKAGSKHSCGTGASNQGAVPTCDRIPPAVLDTIIKLLILAQSTAAMHSLLYCIFLPPKPYIIRKSPLYQSTKIGHSPRSTIAEKY